MHSIGEHRQQRGITRQRIPQALLLEAVTLDTGGGVRLWPKGACGRGGG